MCGIVAAPNSQLFLDKAICQHRGPNQTYRGTHSGWTVIFHRLAVTGGGAGNAPITSETGRWLVALNGEVVNFKALQLAYRLRRSKSDTQTIADGIEKVGLRFLSAIRGMYAGLVIDQQDGEVFAFRDPLGEKPLFLGRSGGNIVLASEFIGVLKGLGRGLKLNNHAIRSLIRFGYVEEPITMDTDIRCIPRGSIVQLASTGPLMKMHSSLPGYSADETDTRLSDLLEVVLSEHLDCNVNRAIALSGGIDSASIAQGTSRHSQGIPLALHVNFKASRSFSALAEHLSARAISRKFALDSSTISIRSPDQLADLAMSFVEAIDQPVFDTSGIGYLSIFREASRRGVAVVFLGHGPDEFFWGYPRTNGLLTSAISGQGADGLKNKILDRREVPHDYGWLEGEISPWFSSSDEFLQSDNLWRRTRALLSHSYLSHNGLAQSDRLAMSCGVEPRAPWSDSRIYGWSQTRPEANQFDALGKALFRAEFEGSLPALTQLKPKRGFVNPVSDWISGPSGRELLASSEYSIKTETAFSDDTASAIMEVDAFGRLVLGLWLEYVRGLHFP